MDLRFLSDALRKIATGFNDLSDAVLASPSITGTAVVKPTGSKSEAVSQEAKSKATKVEAKSEAQIDTPDTPDLQREHFLAAIRKDKPAVLALLTKYGAEKLTAVPADKLPAFMVEVRAI